MTRIEATGRIHPPVLHVSHGRGNTDEPEAHIHLTDPETGQTIIGWFPLEALKQALNPNGIQ
jgi:hypothetical protein